MNKNRNSLQRKIKASANRNIRFSIDNNSSHRERESSIERYNQLISVWTICNVLRNSRRVIKKPTIIINPNSWLELL